MDKNQFAFSNESLHKFLQAAGYGLCLYPASRGKLLFQISNCNGHAGFRATYVRKSDSTGHLEVISSFETEIGAVESNCDEILFEVNENGKKVLLAAIKISPDVLTVRNHGNYTEIISGENVRGWKNTASRIESTMTPYGAKCKLDTKAFFNSLSLILASESDHVTENKDVVLEICDETLHFYSGYRDRMGEAKLVMEHHSGVQAMCHVPFEVMQSVWQLSRKRKSNTMEVQAINTGTGITIESVDGRMAFLNYTKATLQHILHSNRSIDTIKITNKECRNLVNILQYVTSGLNQNSVALKSTNNGKVIVEAARKDCGHNFVACIRAGIPLRHAPFDLLVDPISLAKCLTHYCTSNEVHMDICPNDELVLYNSNSGFNRVKILTNVQEKGSHSTKIFASGGTEFAKDSIHNNFLMAYSELRPQIQNHPELFPAYLEEKGLLDENRKVFMDSGAYTAWQLGHPVDLNAYIRFLQANKDYLDIYVMLDVIRGSVFENFENYTFMRDAGLDPLYVWHLYENEIHLDRLFKLFPMLKQLGAGGAPHTNDAIREPYVQSLLSHPIVSKCKNHLFGMTSSLMLRKYRNVYSVDSTSWGHNARNKRIDTPFGHYTVFNDRDDNYQMLPFRNAVEEFVASLSYGAWDFDLRTLDPESKDSFHWLHQYNLAYLNWYEQYRQYADWMKIEERFIPNKELLKKGEYCLDNINFTNPITNGYQLLKYPA